MPGDLPPKTSAESVVFGANDSGRWFGRNPRRGLKGRSMKAREPVVWVYASLAGQVSSVFNQTLQARHVCNQAVAIFRALPLL